MNKSSRVENSLFNTTSKSPISSTSTNRKTLLERLAALRIHSDPQPLNTNSSNTKVSTKPESPRYIPRNNQNQLKTKIYNNSKPSNNTEIIDITKFSNNNFDNNDDDNDNPPSSPTIGRRRRLAAGLTNTNNNNINYKGSNTSTNYQISSPIGISSPKNFQKQKVLEMDMNSTSVFQTMPQIQTPDIQAKNERNHTAKDIVSSFINSFTILNTFLTKSNAPVAKIQLQNMNDAFAALQMDLKAAVNSVSLLQASNEQKKIETKAYQEEINKISDMNHTIEEQLKISLSHVSEITISLKKEKSNVEFLQNYMEEVLQLKDDGEKQTIQLRKRISDLEQENEILIESINNKEKDKNGYQNQTSTPQNYNLKEENEKLKETIKLLELERFSTKNVCEQAIQVLDQQKSTKSSQIDSSSTNFELLQTELNQIRQELKQKQIEIDKLQGREKHFKESNEIFQQKLLILTEENRKLKGQRPINHY